MLALRLLILGGTTEASELARALAGRMDVEPILSFAGRTEKPALPPIPHRFGGFGGVGGLAAFLRDQAIGAVVDATHPFAARISANAVAACREVRVPLAVYTRPPWTALSDDRWVSVPDIEAAVTTLRDLSSEGASPPSLRGAQATKQFSRALLDCFASLAMTAGGEQSRPGVSVSDEAVPPPTRWLRDRLRTMGKVRFPLGIFLTTGRLDLARFRAAPQHQYLIRTIDPPDPATLPPHMTVLLARPPFAVGDEIALMRAHRIDLLVTKNSGGAASASKLAAARGLGMPVLMIERPPSSGALELHGLEAVLAWISDQRP